MAQIQSSIILLEDDVSLSRAMERVLQLSGFHTLAFRTLEALVEAGAAATATCFVFDTSVAQASGMNVRQQLGASARTPVIFISGYSEPETRAQSEATGNATFIAKPFTGRTLVEAVHRVLINEATVEKAPSPG